MNQRDAGYVYPGSQIREPGAPDAAGAAENVREADIRGVIRGEPVKSRKYYRYYSDSCSAACIAC